MYLITGGIIGLIGLRVPTNGTSPTPPMNPTLNRTRMGVVKFYGRFGTHATSRTNVVVPIIVSMCRSHSFAFVAGAPPTPMLLGGTTNVRSNSNRPGGGGINAMAHSRIGRVTRAGVMSLGTTSMRTTVHVIRNATHSVNVAIRSWFGVRLLV